MGLVPGPSESSVLIEIQHWVLLLPTIVPWDYLDLWRSFGVAQEFLGQCAQESDQSWLEAGEVELKTPRTSSPLLELFQAQLVGQRIRVGIRYRT